MSQGIEGKVVLITGGGTGLGAETARLLASKGAIVAIAARRRNKLDEVVAQITGAGGRASAYLLDVADKKQFKGVVDVVIADFGRLDVLINNAGVNTMDHRVAIDQFPRHEWDRILAVDLTGLFDVSRFGARAMRAQGSGRIINIASVVGLVPLRLQCAYVAAKAGVVNLTRSMALELGPHGVLVNGIAPGSTLTEGTRRLFYAEGGTFRSSVAQMLAHVPLGRPAEVREIAVAALFLADPENSYMNGHILTIDGGWTAGYTRDF